MQSLIDTLTCFNNYIAGGPKKPLDDRMSYYGAKKIDFNRDFYKTTIGSNEDLRKLVCTLLHNLQIDKRQWGRYLDTPLTFYELLVELREQNRNNNRLNKLIERIDEHSWKQWVKIIFGGVIAIGIIEISLPILTHLVGLSTIQELIAAAIFAPIAGSIVTTAVALYSLYQTLNNKSLSLSQQFLDNFFLLAHVALKFIAFGLLLTAVTTTTPVVATLFVLAEGINVLKEIASLAHIFIQDLQRVVSRDSHDLATLELQARHDFDFIKRRNNVLIDIAAAAVCVGFVAAWCFVPGGLFVAIGVSVGIGLVFLAKRWAHHLVEEAIKTQLQRKFEAIEQDEHPRQAEVTMSQQVEDDFSLHSSPPPQIKSSADDCRSRPSLGGMFSVREHASLPSNSCLGFDEQERSDVFP